MKNDPLDPIIDEIGQLLDMAKKLSSQPMEGTLEKDIENKLNFLEKSIDQFTDAASKQIEKEGHTVQSLREKVRDDFESYSSEDKKLLNKTFELGREVRSMMMGLEMARAQMNMGKQKIIGKNPEKKEAQKRKGKFKKMGGEGWKKL
jgi:hypothetical protein